MAVKPKKSVADIKAHFQKRLLERYGIIINRREYKAIGWHIRNGSAKFVGKESNARTHWVVEIKGQPVYVVYNRLLGDVCTALEMDWLPVG